MPAAPPPLPPPALHRLAADAQRPQVRLKAANVLDRLLRLPNNLQRARRSVPLALPNSFSPLTKVIALSQGKLRGFVALPLDVITEVRFDCSIAPKHGS